MAERLVHRVFELTFTFSKLDASLGQRTPSGREACYAVGMASMNEIFVYWPLIVAVPVAIILGLGIAAMFNDKP